MDELRELAMAFTWLIRVGVGTRITYCFIKMINNDDEASVYKKRIKNAIGFFILSESIWQLKDIVMYYFG
jgi:hypothetical protein